MYNSSFSPVLEVRVWSTRAIHADVPREGNVGAAVGLAHNGYNGDSGRRAHGLRTQLRQQYLLKFGGNGGDNIDETRLGGTAMFTRYPGLELVQINILFELVGGYELFDDVRNCEEKEFLRGGDGPNPLLLLSHCYML